MAPRFPAEALRPRATGRHRPPGAGKRRLVLEVRALRRQLDQRDLLDARLIGNSALAWPVRA